MRPASLFPLLFLLAVTPAQARLDAAWRAAPANVPADSLGALFARWEPRGGPRVSPGEAAYARGQFHYARGEFDAAAGAFQRAAAKLEGPDRLPARYAWARAALAMGRAAAARAAFEEVAGSGAPERALARLGVAQCLEAEGDAARAFAAYARLVASEPGEAAPAALERYAALAGTLHRERDAAEARRRLRRDWPRSVEAARTEGE